MVWDRNFASGVHGLRPRNLRRRVLIFDRLNIAQLCLRHFLLLRLGTEYLDEPLLLLYHQVLISQELLRLSYLTHIFIDFGPQDRVLLLQHLGGGFAVLELALFVG